MVLPLVTWRMKELSDGVCLRIDPRQVCAFVEIAIDARKREVVEIVASAMFLWNDVLDVKNSERRIVLVQPAVFASVPGALTSLSSNARFHFPGLDPRSVAAL